MLAISIIINQALNRAGSHKAAARLVGWAEVNRPHPGAILRRSNLPPTLYSGESLVTTAQSFSIWQAIREIEPGSFAGPPANTRKRTPVREEMK
jgi:hypothetical protein